MSGTGEKESRVHERESQDSADLTAVIWGRSRYGRMAANPDIKQKTRSINYGTDNRPF